MAKKFGKGYMFIKVYTKIGLFPNSLDNLHFILIFYTINTHIIDDVNIRSKKKQKIVNIHRYIYYISYVKLYTRINQNNYNQS